MVPQGLGQSHRCFYRAYVRVLKGAGAAQAQAHEHSVAEVVVMLGVDMSLHVSLLFQTSNPIKQGALFINLYLIPLVYHALKKHL